MSPEREQALDAELDDVLDSIDRLVDYQLEKVESERNGSGPPDSGKFSTAEFKKTRAAFKQLREDCVDPLLESRDGLEDDPVVKKVVRFVKHKSLFRRIAFG